ncbi:NeuD/PglB/VioB family sugar acetyltransferase [Sulfurimonas sp. HSL-1716]|uniref:NeuD/PglB/VioB family sugar acetyltransferase n=1 Tax=Hydrocurvibacter sulfurireducens TaxID=3131937 RepID=UPI0031F76654
MEKIILIGGGGHCKSCIDVIEQEGRFEIAGIIDQAELIGKKVLGYEVIGSDADLDTLAQKYRFAFIAVGQIRSSEVRVRLFELAKRAGFELPVVISPRAYVSKHAKVEEGTIIMHDALVNADAKIGRNCIINSKALIEHDAVVEDNCHISTGAIINGGTVVKSNTFYGSSATSKENTEASGFVKAGSVVK